MPLQNEINIEESTTNPKSNNAMSVALCTRAFFVKKISRQVARIWIYLPATFSIHTPFSHVNDVNTVPCR